MRKLFLVSLLLVAASAFGHAGEVHKYMGTIAAVHGDGFTLKTTDGTSMQVVVSKATVYVDSDGKGSTRAGLAAGRRAVVTISTDGRTATEVKFAKARQN